MDGSFRMPKEISTDLGWICSVLSLGQRCNKVAILIKIIILLSYSCKTGRKDMTSSQFVVITSVLSKLASFYTELSNHCMLQFANPQQPSNSQTQTNVKEATFTLPKIPNHDNHSHSISSSPQQKQPSTQTASKKKGRPRKQPVPKIKASTSYYLFFQENKQRVAAKYNITNMKDLATMLSKEWKSLPQAERAKYQLRAIEENRNREGMMDLYRKDYQEQPEQQRKKTSEQEDLKPMQLSPKSGPIPYQTTLSSSSASSSSSSSSSSNKPSRLNKAQVIFIEDSSQTSSKKDDSLQL